MSIISTESQRLLDDVSLKSTSVLHKLQLNVDSDMIRQVWFSFGKYINKQYRMGKSIIVPHFGTFTFSNPLSLNGVTNPKIHDRQSREPIFLVSKHFLNGKNLACGMSTENNLRILAQTSINNNYQLVKCNYTEIALYCDYSKDIARVCCERVFRELEDQIRNKDFGILDIPLIGKLIIKNNIAAIEFDEILKNQLKNILNKTLNERFEKLNSQLTETNLKNLENNQKDINNTPIIVDEQAKTWLSNNLNIDVNQIFSTTKKKISNQEFEENFEFKSTQPVVVLNENFSQKNYTAKKNDYVKMEENDNSFGMKKIREFMRKNNIKPNDFFFELGKAVYGRNASIFSKFNRFTFQQGLDNLHIFLTSGELTSIFQTLDKNKDNLLDIKEITNGFYTENETIQKIRETIKSNNLMTDDVLKRMNITREQSEISESILKNGIRRLISNISDEDLKETIREILGKNNSIELLRFLDIIECLENKEIINEDWLNNILRRIGMQLNKGDKSRLIIEFEKFDKNNQGRLDIANFKTCLFKAKLELDLIEINRICRYLDKDNNMMIDYVAFIKKVNLITNSSDNNDNISNFAENIINFIKIRKIKIKNFFYNLIQGKSLETITVSEFALILKNQIFLNKNLDQIEKLTNFIDVDSDGIISATDFEIFLNRYNYIDNLNFSKTNESFFKTKKSLFPTKPLSEEKYSEVIIDLKKNLREKKISLFDAFKILDNNEDGFISIDEFLIGIDKIIKLSHTVKEGLFAYLDILRIGMIDYPNFLITMKKPVNLVFKKYSEEKKKTGDNWDWQENILNKLRNYIKLNNLNSETAFRLIDMDFDGMISKNDLKEFIIKTLKINSSDVHSTGIDRLFKLLDRFKRGFVQKNDLDIFLSKNNNMDDFWIEQAKQQLGLTISKEFIDIKESFEKISCHTNNINYDKFKNWVDKAQALSGFNLTENLLQTVFAALDPHKKGFLSEKDWENTFGNFNSEKEKIKEIIDCINFNFKDKETAFNYFLQNTTNNIINLNLFITGIYNLLPRRFTKRELTNIFKKITSNKNFIDNEEFTKIFNFVSKKNLLIENEKIELNQIKQKFETNETDLKKEFIKFDKKKNGLINVIEFKNVLKALKIGIKTKEIDELIRKNADEKGFINYEQFLLRIKSNNFKNKMNERVKEKIEKMIDNIKDYFISERDVFRRFNTKGDGELKLEEFTKLITILNKKNNEKIYSYDVIKDLFDFCDLRNDGVIDIHEWSLIFQGKFQNKKKLENISNLIGKNRKIINLKFEKITENNENINFLDGIKVLEDVLSIKMDTNEWLKILNFAIKDNFLDYKFMMDVFKNRLIDVNSHPKDLSNIDSDNFLKNS